MRYNISLQSIAWLRGRALDKTLEISPKFQRRPVWLERERSSLIETIVSKLPFPEIYIHHQVEVRSGIVKHVVVDGQQRVTSILMFIENQFPLPTNDDWHGEYFRDLTEEQSEQFWNYNLVVRDLNETTDAEIRQLFVRLNTNNFALNDQELRNSRFKGAFINSVTRLADNPLFQEIGLFTPRDIRRMNDVEFVSELILLNIEGITNKKDMLDDVYLANEIEFPGEALYEKEFSSALSILRSIISPENANLFRSKTSFYSLYGACLRYYRAGLRTTFKNTAAVEAEVVDLLSSIKRGDVDGKPDYYQIYFETASRAASDRGRRAAREDILVEIIEKCERQASKKAAPKKKR